APENSVLAVCAASSGVAPRATSSRHRSSKCCASSSAISTSRDGERRSDARRGRMSGLQSGMFSSRDQPNGLYELVPGLALSQQHATSRRRQPIEAAPALAGLLDPGACDPPPLLEAIEQRIERVEMEHHPPP